MKTIPSLAGLDILIPLRPKLIRGSISLRTYAERRVISTSQMHESKWLTSCSCDTTQSQ